MAIEFPDATKFQKDLEKNAAIRHQFVAQSRQMAKDICLKYNSEKSEKDSPKRIEGFIKDFKVLSQYFSDISNIQLLEKSINACRYAAPLSDNVIELMTNIDKLKKVF